jgi:coproporphyrinogen III oxidase-like Fe-S oxidoreductase
MTAHSEKEALKKRENIQNRFWNQVGSAEHISLPKLEDALRKEFNREDDRFIQAQIKLMQTEARIRVQSRVKVWIKQPNAMSQAKP